MIDCVVVPEVNLSYETNYGLNVSTVGSVLNGKYLGGKIKIDTGCGTTSLGVKGLFTSVDCRVLKIRDIDLYMSGKIKAVRSYGVHDRDLKNSLASQNKLDLKNCTKDEILNDKRVSFIHMTDDMKINGVSFGKTTFSVNYDRASPSLLGVNFLKEFHGELIKINNTSCFILGDKKDNRLIKKVYDLLREHLLIKDIISKLREQGYDVQSINNAVVEAVQHTYLDE